MTLVIKTKFSFERMSLPKINLFLRLLKEKRKNEMSVNMSNSTF